MVASEAVRLAVYALPTSRAISQKKAIVAWVEVAEGSWTDPERGTGSKGIFFFFFFFLQV